MTFIHMRRIKQARRVNCDLPLRSFALFCALSRSFALFRTYTAQKMSGGDVLPAGLLHDQRFFGLNVAHAVCPELFAKLGPTSMRLAVQKLSPS